MFIWITFRAKRSYLPVSEGSRELYFGFHSFISHSDIVEDECILKKFLRLSSSPVKISFEWLINESAGVSVSQKLLILIEWRLKYFIMNWKQLVKVRTSGARFFSESQRSIESLKKIPGPKYYPVLGPLNEVFTMGKAEKWETFLRCLKMTT